MSCPPFATAGPACLQCWQVINTPEASALPAAITSCLSEFPTLTEGPTLTGTTFYPLPTYCASQCALINALSNDCISNVTCNCPVFLAEGATCQACWETVDTTVANNIFSASTACQVLGFTPLATANSTTSKSGTVIFGVPTGNGASMSRSISGARAGVGQVFGGGLLAFITFLAAVAGTFTVFI